MGDAVAQLEENGELVILANKVVLSDRIIPAAIRVTNGKITKIIENAQEIDSSRNEQVRMIHVPDHCLLLPGVVDSHVHVNEPGRTDWEGFSTATQAAAKGGVTTIADMPLNAIPPTTTIPNLLEKLNAAHDQCAIDVRFIGGFVKENVGNDDLHKLIDAGVCGFKCFLIESGVPEFSFVGEKELKVGLEKLKGKKTFLMFHAEMETETEVDIEDLLETKKKMGKDFDPIEYRSFLHSRPASMENKAIELVIKLCQEFGVHCHIVHLSSAEALPMIRKAKSEGAKITVETCYHYLFFESETIPDAEPRFKCCPPIRESKNREELWNGLIDGTIDMVVSDHSPCTPELKAINNGSYLDSWGGISSLQFGLSILYTESMRRGHTIHDITKWICEKTAHLIGLSERKGKIQVGFDADFAVFDPTEIIEIHQKDILHKNKLTAYEGQKLTGAVKQTILRGQIVYDDGSFSKKMLGSLILKE